ncbi:MAG: LLM class flavin-dependent oxidoreductase [Acidimicrobiales bacterium]|nr:LLM class flavin-dependent oxidoreductase [Acidimicrobiales bacterium]
MSASAHPVEFATTLFCPAFAGGEIARRSEELGFDIQLFGENHNMCADVFGELRLAAAATTRLRLECGPVNFVTRDPGVIASAIAAVQLLSDGRAICGIARGDSAVALAGRAPQRHAGLERDLGVLRTYLGRGVVDHGERESSLQWIGQREYTPPPIQLVCSGPRAIRLAATTADRIGLSVGANPERVGWAMAIIDDALAAAGRTRADVRVGLFLPMAITSDRAGAADALRPRVAGWAHMSSFPGNDLAQQPEVMRRVTEALRTGYDYRYHKAGVPADNPNTRIVDGEFADWFGVGGPPAYLIERLGQLVEAGIDYFVSVLEGTEQERFAAEVMPTVRNAR